MSSDIILFGALLYFLQPLALLFGLAAAIPIVIHFWSRHRHRPMEWAATHYLMLAMQKASSAITFQQLFLLFVRVLIVIVLTLALAGPFSKNGLSLLKSETPKSMMHVIVIDRSFSMQIVQDEKSSLDRAKSIALSIIQNANAGDGFLLFAADTKLDSILAEPIAEKDFVASEVELISASNSVFTPKEIFRQLSELPALNDATLFDEKQIHMISDYSEADWRAKEDDATSNDVREIKTDWEEIVQPLAMVQHHRVPLSNVSNNFITDVRFDEASFLVNKPFQCKVDIENSRSLDWDLSEGRSTDVRSIQQEPVLVELLVDNEMVGSRTVLIPPNEKITIPFELQISKVGEIQVEARIGSDALTLDNRHFRVVETHEKRSVLFVESSRRSSRFLQFALEPNDLARSDFRFEVVDATTLVDEELDKYQFVFLDNVRSLSQADVIRLRRFARSGGSVAIFLGDQVDRAAFNQTWRKVVADLPILPVELLGIVDVDNYRIDTMDYLSPLLLSFRGNEDSGLSEMPIWNYFKTKIDDPSLVRVDLSLQNGDLLLITCKLGNGQCVLFTSSSSSLSRSNNVESTSWNANEAWPSFPPLIQEIFQSGSQFNAIKSFQIGDSIFGELERDSLMKELSVRHSNGDKVDAVWRQSDSVVEWSSDPVLRPGVVSVDSKTQEGELTQKFSVNVSSQESRLDSLPVDDELFSKSDLIQSAVQTKNRFQGYQFLLILLGVLLLCETALSQRFGRAQ